LTNEQAHSPLDWGFGETRISKSMADFFIGNAANPGVPKAELSCPVLQTGHAVMLTGSPLWRARLSL
jgi:hypothetical protein